MIRWLAQIDPTAADVPATARAIVYVVHSIITDLISAAAMLVSLYWSWKAKQQSSDNSTRLDQHAAAIEATPGAPPLPSTPASKPATP